MSGGFLRRLAVAWFCFIGMFMPFSGATQDLRPFRTGLILSKQDRHLEAAESWRSVAEKLARDARSPEERRIAGIGFVLSTLAFEKAGDARAYRQWGKAIETFLNGRTQWLAQRAALATRRLEIEQLFAAVSPDTDAGEIDDETVFFLELTGLTAMSDFDGPRPGLTEEATERPVSRSEEEEARQYFARPLSAIQRDNASTPYSDPEADPAASASVRQRGAHPVVSDPAAGVAPPASAPVLQRRGVPTQPANSNVIVVPSASTQAVRSAVRGQGGEGRLALTEDDLDRARHAWRFIQENLQTNTGLVNAMNQYPRTTLWEVGSTLAAWIAAEQLQLIPRVRFQANIERLMVTLEKLALYGDVLPNVEYDTETGGMVDAHGRPSDRGAGWSALDIGRTLIWLRILHDWYPIYQAAVREVVAGWELAELVGEQGLRRVVLEGGVERAEQQGRFGYEHYAAAGLGAWELFVPTAEDFDDVGQVEIMGIGVPYDVRPFSYLTSEPFMLAALELGGISSDFARFTEAIYAVQRQRYETLDVVSAVTEDALAQPPWFVYNTIFYGGRPWQALGPDGSEQSGLSAFSVKAAFAWSAIYDDSFTEQLMARADPLRHERFGFLAGVFDHGEPNRALNLNTNAVVLEAILFKLRGGRPFLELRRTEMSRGAARRP